MKRVFASVVLGLGFAACQSVGAPEIQGRPPADIEAFAALVENVFETPDGAENNIRDKRVRIMSDSLQGVWFYTQLNTRPERKLYRQRLSHLKISEDGSAIVQTTYGLNTPEKYVDAWNHPVLLSTLKPEDFTRYFKTGCEQVWRPADDGAWMGYVDPQTCVITSKRRGKDIRIESEGYLSKDVYRTNERGYDMDMTFLWGTKPGEMITLYPVQP